MSNPTADSLKPRRKEHGLRRVLRAIKLSFQGIVGAFRHEEAFRQDLLFACIALPVGLWLGHNGVERALLVAPVLLILIVELINSAIEATVDRIGMERHELAGLAKDIGSASVLMAFLLFGLVWILVLFGR